MRNFFALPNLYSKLIIFIESVESPPSDFKIQREGSDFLRPDIILSIPSKTSQFTAISEYEAPQQRRRMSEASKVVSQERDRRISGDFRVAADMPSIETCNKISLI